MAIQRLGVRKSRQGIYRSDLARCCKIAQLPTYDHEACARDANCKVWYRSSHSRWMLIHGMGNDGHLHVAVSKNPQGKLLTVVSRFSTSMVHKLCSDIQRKIRMHEEWKDETTQIAKKKHIKYMSSDDWDASRIKCRNHHALWLSKVLLFFPILRVNWCSQPLITPQCLLESGFLAKVYMLQKNQSRLFVWTSGWI